MGESGQSIFEVIIQTIFALVLFNIPTFILIAIYFACREKVKKSNEIEKMNKQDL